MSARSSSDPVDDARRRRALQVRHDTLTNGVVMRVTGEIDQDTVPILAEHLVATLRATRPPTPVVLDLRSVTFLGSAGLSVLMRSQSWCAEQGTPLRIVADRREVLRPFQITGLTDVLAVYPNVDQALCTASRSGPE
jgi:anti-sigma B factor antagonist